MRCKRNHQKLHCTTRHAEPAEEGLQSCIRELRDYDIEELDAGLRRLEEPARTGVDGRW